jgi:hypothetical protein
MRQVPRIEADAAGQRMRQRNQGCRWGSTRSLVAVAGLMAACLLPAQGQAWGQTLPSIPALIAKVQANQRTLDKTREQYTYREMQIEQELNKHGGVEKQHSREYNVFYVNGHPMQKLVRRDGALLSKDEEAKELVHMQQKIELAQKTPPGELLNNRHQVSVGRLLLIEHFDNERRVTMDNRPMIALDFRGDPKAQTHGIAEDASKHLSGTVWIDEQDLQVRKVQATLDSAFHLEMGLVSLSQGSSFTFDQKIINNEVWLPTGATIHVEARAAFFLGYHINVQITDDQYRRFQASAAPAAATAAAEKP